MTQKVAQLLVTGVELWMVIYLFCGKPKEH